MSVVNKSFGFLCTPAFSLLLHRRVLNVYRQLLSVQCVPRCHFELYFAITGSEAESDEDDDLDDDADVMEMEAGDLDLNMSQQALKNQVSRVHVLVL